MKQSISQSLAGRTGLARLYPFSQTEIKKLTEDKEPFEICFSGFYPVIHSENIPPQIFYPNYYQTYLERDISQSIELKNSKQFRTFIRLIAGRTGQLVNYNSIASDTGVSNNTIKEWLSILEASFIVYTLAPYYKNIRKRLIKSPKIFMTDTGLLCSLLGIESMNQLTRDPLRDNIFENYIVMDIIKELYHHGKDPKAYFLRDSKGMEVDLLIEINGINKLIEIKSSSTWNKEFGKNLKRTAELLDAPTQLFVIYSGAEEMTFENIKIRPAKDAGKILID